MGFQQAWDGFTRFRDAASSGAGIEGGIARAVCDAYAGQPVVVEAGTNATNPAFGIVVREGCKEYWEGPDGYTPPTPPGEAPPFEGGQCPILYRIRLLVDATTGTGTAPQLDAVGPLQSITFSPSSLPPNAPSQPLTLTVVNGAGQALTATADAAGGSEGATFEPQIFALNGVPDDCGDPPASPVPPQPGAPPVGTGFGNPRDVGEPGSPFVVTPRLPELGPDGPYFPIDTPVGTEPYDPMNPGARPRPEPPSVGEPIDVDGSGEVAADPEDEGVKPALLGYRFDVRDDAPQFQSVIPGTSPRIYSRIVGSVQLVLKGESGTFYSDNLQITSQEGSIVKQHPTLQVVGCVYNVLPSLEGLTLREIRGKDNDS